MFVILVYDFGEKRVGRALKRCRKYLTWVQNSVFEGDISEANLKKLKYELTKIMVQGEDSVIIYSFKIQNIQIEKLSVYQKMNRIFFYRISLRICTHLTYERYIKIFCRPLMLQKTMGVDGNKNKAVSTDLFNN